MKVETKASLLWYKSNYPILLEMSSRKIDDYRNSFCQDIIYVSDIISIDMLFNLPLHANRITTQGLAYEIKR